MLHWGLGLEKKKVYQYHSVMERMKSKFCGCCLRINSANSGYHHILCPFTAWLIVTSILLLWAAAAPTGEWDSLALAAVHKGLEKKKKVQPAPPQVRKHGGAFERSHYLYWHEDADSRQRNISPDRTAKRALCLLQILYLEHRFFKNKGVMVVEGGGVEASVLSHYCDLVLLSSR